jgi:hypothetical protein
VVLFDKLRWETKREAPYIIMKKRHKERNPFNEIWNLTHVK